jgi:hypothetical protein
MQNNDKVLQEVRQRVVRLESRLVVMAQQLGVAWDVQDHVAVNVADRTADLTALDVPLSVVVNKCRRLNLHGSTVTLYFKNEPLAELYV